MVVDLAQVVAVTPEHLGSQFALVNRVQILLGMALEAATGWLAWVFLSWVGPLETTILAGQVSVTVAAATGATTVAAETAAVSTAAAGASSASACAAGAAAAVVAVGVVTLLVVGFVEGFASQNVRLYKGEMDEAIDPEKHPGETNYVLIAEQGIDKCFIYCFRKKKDMDQAKHKFFSSRIMYELNQGQFCEIEQKGFAMPFNTIRYAFVEAVRRAYLSRQTWKLRIQGRTDGRTAAVSQFDLLLESPLPR